MPSREKTLAALIAAGILLFVTSCAPAKLSPTGSSRTRDNEVTSSNGRSTRAEENRQFQNVFSYEDIVNWQCPESVNRREALADLARFRHILEQAYVGYDYFADGGHDWAATFASLKTDVEAKRKWTPYELASLLAKALRFTNDMHFSFSVKRPEGQKDVRVGRHASPYFAEVLAKRLDDGRLQIVGAPEDAGKQGELFLETCRGESPDAFLFRTLAPHIGAEVYLLGVLSNEPVNSLPVQVCTDDGRRHVMALHMHRGRMAGYRADYRSAFDYRNEPFPVLRLTTFDILGGSSDVKEQLKRFLDSATLPELEQSPYVLVDLRGNGGGMDQAYRPWLLKLTNEPIRSSSGASLVSPLVYEGVANAQLLFHVGSGQATEGSFEALRDNLLDGVFQGLPEEHRELLRGYYEVDKRCLFSGGAQLFEATASSRFPGTLLILYDGRTASAAEGFIAMARQLECAVLLGENSAGTSSFGEIFPFMLPHSRVLLYCGHNLIRDERGEIHEGIGYLPDYWFDVTDPLDVILNHAELVRA